MKRAARFALGATLVVTLGACSLTGSKDPLTLKSGEKAKVAQVIKGDELEVERDGKVARLRVLGIYCFEDVIRDDQLTPLIEASKAFMASTLLNKEITVTLEEPPLDRHGRYLAYVDIDGGDVGKLMIDTGNAVTYTEYPFSREATYLGGEGKARAAKAQLWANPKAQKAVLGMRKLWHESRAKSSTFVDPLLAEAAALEPTPNDASGPSGPVAASSPTAGSGPVAAASGPSGP